MRHPINPKWDRFESLNPGSVSEQLAKVACGEADAFVNLGGPKGYELIAGYPLIKRAAGFTLDLRTERELGESKVIFEERIPIIAAKDEKLARDIYEQIR